MKFYSPTILPDLLTLMLSVFASFLMLDAFGITTYLRAFVGHSIDFTLKEFDILIFCNK